MHKKVLTIPRKMLIEYNISETHNSLKGISFKSASIISSSFIISSCGLTVVVMFFPFLYKTVINCSFNSNYVDRFCVKKNFVSHILLRQWRLFMNSKPKRNKGKLYHNVTNLNFKQTSIQNFSLTDFH